MENMETMILEEKNILGTINTIHGIWSQIQSMGGNDTEKDLIGAILKKYSDDPEYTDMRAIADAQKIYDNKLGI